MHRRAFLDPRRLAQQAGHVIGALNTVDPPQDPREETEQTLVRYSRPAMGTVFEIVLPFGHPLLTTTIHDALDLIDSIESQLTIYRSDSEVSELNRRASTETVRVSPQLFDLLLQSSQLSHATEGAFDVTSGVLIDTWGFVRGPRRVPTDAEREQALSRTGWKALQLSMEDTSVRFLAPGLLINLGSIGKGYALDRTAAFLTAILPEQPVLLHGGKSSVLGCGTPPGHSHGWSVAIEHPWNPEEHLATITLLNRACATSAPTYKHLVHEGKKLGHILDPRTGWPAQGIASATAIADTAAEADALATAFFIMGVEPTKRFCQHHQNVSALLLPEGSRELICLNL